MDNLNDVLEWHISRKHRIFVAYGINAGNYGDSTAYNGKAGSAYQLNSIAQAWTTVSIYTNKVIDMTRAVETLRLLEDDISKWLSPDQKPERLAFYVEDDSKTAYWAESSVVRGKLSARDAAGQMGVVSSTDEEKTRPNTPRPELEEVMKDIIKIEL
ncbi:hypothetical protein F4819DRAFT_108108 [Hypoxylon fuscum]|nr:hypothetical protein F4819DRAFT_108108 [Hypoxylon fuscum]